MIKWLQFETDVLSKHADDRFQSVCAWNREADLLATGGQDGVVRVFKMPASPPPFPAEEAGRTAPALRNGVQGRCAQHARTHARNARLPACRHACIEKNMRWH